jgi:hypothetical protein
LHRSPAWISQKIGTHESAADCSGFLDKRHLSPFPPVQR